MYISPAMDSGLSSDTYSVMLPKIAINLTEPKNISSARTIGGGAVVSVWSSNIEGAQRSVNMSLSAEQYKALRLINDSGVDEWLMRAQGRIFLIVPSIDSAIPAKRDRWSVTFSFVILEEITAT